MKKDPLKKLMVETLGRSFYLNVVQFNYDEKWYPMFYAKWVGSEKCGEAVALRKEAAKYLHDEGSDLWKDGKNIKTVKVTLFS